MSQMLDARSKYTAPLKSREFLLQRKFIPTISETLPTAPQLSSLLVMIQRKSTVFLLDSDGISLFSLQWDLSFITTKGFQQQLLRTFTALQTIISESKPVCEDRTPHLALPAPGMIHLNHMTGVFWKH